MTRKYAEGLVCSVGECEADRKTRDWCHKHYKRWQLYGDPLKLHQYDCKGKTCGETDCKRPARKVGLCNSHYTRRWRTDNPELAKKNTRNCWTIRAMRKKNAPGYHSWKEWEDLVEQYEGLCAYCKEAPAESRDHVVPIAAGGTNDIENILPACLRCNKSKGAKALEEWLPWKD